MEAITLLYDFLGLACSAAPPIYLSSYHIQTSVPLSQRWIEPLIKVDLVTEFSEYFFRLSITFWVLLSLPLSPPSHLHWQPRLRPHHFSLRLHNPFLKLVLPLLGYLFSLFTLLPGWSVQKTKSKQKPIMIYMRWLKIWTFLNTW